MKNIARTLFILIFSLICHLSPAQNAEMADGLRSDGKIYVIVLIIGVVLAGMIIYLFTLDRKLDKMEKRMNEKHP